MKEDIPERDDGQIGDGRLEDTTRVQIRHDESASLERVNELVLSFLLYTGLTFGEESGRANKFRGSSEVGRTIDISTESSSSSSPWSNSRSSASASESLDSSDVSETMSSPSLGTGEGDGARLHLLEAMSLVLEGFGEHELAVSALLCLSLSTTLNGRSGGYRGAWVRTLCFRISRSGE